MRVIDTFRTVMSLAYSPCGRFLYSAGWEHVSRWDVFSGEETPIHHAPGRAYLTHLAVSPSGNRIGWVEQSAPQLHLQEVRPSGVGERDRSRPVSLLTAKRGGPGGWWGFVLGDQVIRHPRPLVTDPTGRGVAFVKGGELSLAVLDRPPRKPFLAQTLEPEHLAGVGVRRLSGIASGSFGFATATRLWWYEGDDLCLFDAERSAITRVERPAARPLAVTPDGRTGIAATGRDVLLIDLPSGLTRERFNWDVGTVEAVAVAPDGLTAAVAGWAGGIAIFDLDG